MSTINRLSSVDVLQPSDQIPVWDSSNGDTRKASMSTLLAFVESYFADPDYTTRIVAPNVDGFNVDIGNTGDSSWLIVNPTLNYTTGSITLPTTAYAVNDQEITVVFTAQVSSFSITGAGATVLGAPTQIGTYDSFRVRYNAAQLTWYTLDTTGDGSGSGTSSIVRQQFTGDGTTTTFTLANTPAALGELLQVFIDGVYQERAGYSVSGNDLVFSEAPPVLSTIEVLAWGVNDIGATTANLVTYTPAGTGAVATTVQDKLRESVSVLDFGAVGDGVTDDTAAIQAAFDFAEGGVVFLEDGKTYYIGTGTVVAADGHGHTVGLRIRSNTTLDGRGATLTSDLGQATPSGANQFLILQNYLGGATSENITVKNTKFKHTGTDGYYTSGLWISGGETSNPEHYVNTINIDGCFFDRTRAGVVIRDNKPTTVPIATNTIRQISGVRITNTTAKDVTSAVIAPDGDNIYIDGVVADHSGAAEAFDTVSMVRGNNVIISNVISKGLTVGYGVLVRNRTGSNTTNITISNITCQSGKGVRIGTDSAGTTEELSNITASNILIQGGALLVEKSVNTMIMEKINLNNIMVEDGTTLDGLAGIGMRIFAQTSAGVGVTDVNANNITISKTTGIAFEIQESQRINITNLNASRLDTTQPLFRIEGDCDQINVSNFILDNGSIGLDFLSASSNITNTTFRDGVIRNCTVSIETDGSEVGDSVRFENVDIDAANNFTGVDGSYFANLVGRGGTLTIATGAISATHEWHRINTEAAAATDDLDNINNGSLGQIITLSILTAARVVVIRHNGGGAGGNIRTISGASVSLTSELERVQFQYSGSVWVQL